MRKHKYSFLLQTVQATVRLSLWSTRLWISVALWMPIGAIALGQSNLSESERKVEEVWRSSEEPGEVSTSKRKRRMKYRLPEPPPGAFRIGCICMDGTRADTRGIGSCSGHGGVRYWVYRLKDGDTVHLFTEHHLKHPEDLPAEKMMELSRRRADRIRRMEESRSTFGTAPAHGHELSDNGRDAARSLRAGGVSVARGGEYGGRRGKRVRGNATALALEREQSGVSEICITSFATTSKATASATASPESSKKTAAIEYKSRYS